MGRTLKLVRTMEWNDPQPPPQHPPRRSCPCKRVPLYLSSFTAAEHGNVQALLARQERHHSNSGDWTRRQDSAGNTPLHLAAQHGHTAVTALLLRTSNDDDDVVNAAAGGATPLHRAAYAGAVATMQLLLEVPSCNLLARDSSFGDLQTPLHKACSGGRYLAVQLLLQSLSLRSCSSSTLDDPVGPRTLLEQALQMRDAAGLTPLQVARQQQENEQVERCSVARWDSVAGGVADWEKCIRLLEEATAATTTKSPYAPDPAATIKQQALPEHLQSWSQEKQQQAIEDCDCEDENGHCLTASWEQAFRTALQTTVDSTLSAKIKVSVARHAQSLVNENTVDKADDGPVEKFASDSSPSSDQQNAAGPQNDESQSKNTQQTTARPGAGLQCSSCAKPSIVLYSCDGTLICKKCRQKRRLSQQLLLRK